MDRTDRSNLVRVVFIEASVGDRRPVPELCVLRRVDVAFAAEQLRDLGLLTDLLIERVEACRQQLLDERSEVSDICATCLIQADEGETLLHVAFTDRCGLGLSVHVVFPSFDCGAFRVRRPFGAPFRCVVTRGRLLVGICEDGRHAAATFLSNAANANYIAFETLFQKILVKCRLTPAYELSLVRAAGYLSLLACECMADN